MSFLQQLLGIKPPPQIEDQEKALKKYDAESERLRAQAEFERDRTARIATYLRCMEEGRDDCRVDISWEEMARQGATNGST